jgi:hypothetical protein
LIGSGARPTIGCIRCYDLSNWFQIAFSKKKKQHNDSD